MKTKWYACVGMLLMGSACGPATWNVESETVESSHILLNDARELELKLVAETSHAGRVNAWVRLPGLTLSPAGPEPDVDVPMNEFEQPAQQQQLVVAELVLDDAHSVVRLPGVGGGLSVRCPGERCTGAEARLSIRVLDGREVPEAGVIVDWSASAETFGQGQEPPPGVRALLQLD